MSKAALLLLLSSGLSAEIRPRTLRHAVEIATRQNPDVLLARLDEEKARQGVRVAHDPFTPRLTVGSGLAYSNGFPMSIEGSAPSVVQARASEFIFNRPRPLVPLRERPVPTPVRPVADLPFPFYLNIRILIV